MLTGVRVRLYHPGPGYRLEVVRELIPHMRAKKNKKLPFCVGFNLGTPGLKSPSKMGWEVGSVTHVHLGIRRIINASAQRASYQLWDITATKPVS